jgi:polysaccharide export outer membrane protein
VRRTIAIILTLAAAMAIDPHGAAAAQESEAHPDYAIGPEDVLDIAVWNNADISRTVPVRPDGKISLPLLNDVQAAGLSPAALRAVLAARLADYVSSPIVSVIVREIHSVKVTVIGEVKTPGRYELRSRTTVLEVLAMAGGLSQYAARARITVLRRDGEKVRELPYDFEKVMTRTSPKGAPQDNFCVQAGDIVVVP